MVKVQIDTKDFKEKLKNALIGLGIDAVEQLQLTAPVASGHLRNNIDFNVEEVGSQIELTISMPFYAKYVEWGTPPHMPPIEAIEEWLKAKGLPEEMAWPVAMTIKKQGTHPQPFIRPYFNTKLNQDIARNLANALK